MRRTLFLFVLSWLLAVPASAAPTGTAFTYQGSLDKSGVPGSGTCTFQFRLFDSASGGAQVGPTLTPSVTLLENGQFSTTLDFGGVFDGSARWLEVAVQCPGDPDLTVLGPRQPLTPAPYALFALSAPGGGGFTLPFFGPITAAAQDAFMIQNNATSGAFYAIHGVSATSATNAGGVLGEATAASGQVVGVYGRSTTSPNGIGMVGQGNVNGAVFEALTTSGDGTAVFGIAHTTSNNAAGVKGVNYSTTGSTVGVWGWAGSSANGTGVVGAGGANGGYFSTASVDALGDFAGVYGVASLHPGVKGSSSAGTGVRGEGLTGVVGASKAGTGGTGVIGLGDGSGTGVDGTSAGGVGVHGGSLNADGVHGTSTNGLGVHGSSTAGAGVYGESNSSIGVSGVSQSYFGVLGVSGSGAGVKGISGSAQGVYGQSSAAGNGGVVGTNTSAAGYGGWFSNDAGGVALYANGLAQVKTMQILGADLAESFPIEGGGAEPGTVLAIADGSEGALRICDEAYSHRVAGVVSGANGLDAAVVLQGAAFGQQGHASVAMSGRVWVRCDAGSGAIRPGDLLTSSGRAGFAMRVADRERAYGAILGKAMTSLEAGTGLVLVLVNLQ